MKTKTLLTVITFIFVLSTFSQNPALELTFTAIDNAAYVQLDSIKVMNRTQGGDTTLYWPDTSIVLGDPVGIPENSSEKYGFKVMQNYPNPVTDQTTISMYVPFRDDVRIIITDMMGRVILKSDMVLEKGIHSFNFVPGDRSVYLFTAKWKGENSSIKILKAAANSNYTSSLEYTGSEPSSQGLKSAESIQSFSFDIGDELLYIGYGNALQAGILDTPETSETFILQFATNIPCPGTPTVEYEGQIYNTIQIFSQCWLKENLNVGIMINGNNEMEDNGIIEKYCYDNLESNCDIYGGLYQWNEVMQYTTQQGVKGICPDGWHIPTDEDWKVLEGAVDSHYGIGDAEWDIFVQSRGFDAGKNLKSTSGWLYSGNGTDLFGFSGLPAGYSYDGIFITAGSQARWYTSSEYSSISALFRLLQGFHSQISRFVSDFTKDVGFPVRCVKDN